MTVRLGRTIPALPVRDMVAAVAHYSERFGFDVPLADDGFALLRRDDAELHLWAASDEDWRTRADLARRPVCSGAESFIAGTASCRIEARDVDALYAELRDAQVIHGASKAGCPQPTSARASSMRPTSTAIC
jgi:hypothetical protein